MRIRLLTDPHLRDTAYVVSVLKRLGFRASGGPVAGERYNLLASNSRNHTQISVGGTLTDYPGPSNIIQTWLSCDSFRPGSGSNAKRAGFCDPSIDAGASSGPRAEDLGPEGRESAVGTDRSRDRRPGTLVADREPEHGRLPLRKPSLSERGSSFSVGGSCAHHSSVEWE
jgi:hypothetical protein